MKAIFLGKQVDVLSLERSPTELAMLAVESRRIFWTHGSEDNLWKAVSNNLLSCARVHAHIKKDVRTHAFRSKVLFLEINTFLRQKSRSQNQ